MGAVKPLAASLAVAAVLAGGGAVAAGGLDAVVGKAVFERVWVAAGASTGSADGLGPLHNARSCAGCHLGGGGAAVKVDADGALTGPGLVVRLGGTRGDPVYGHQIQTRALPGHPAEAVVRLAAVHGDGEPGPRVAVTLDDPVLGPPTVPVGVRRAPSLVGRGAFDRVDPAAVLALADPDDADGDGISGRARFVGDGAGGRVLGRYGWRASGDRLERQVAAAFSVDLGLSTAAFPDPAGDCTASQPACREARHGGGDRGGETEVGDPMIAVIAAYVAGLRPAAPAAGEGAALFAAAGCAACHMPALPAVGGGSVPAFTDFLLHDLGPGLADPATDDDVAPSDWRTAPLLGLAGARADSRRFLHDGRAATLAEAIAWHDGEAAAARDAFGGLSDEDRATLLRYLESL
jgi:CxxC motif-containing protein (DUF1111 family)